MIAKNTNSMCFHCGVNYRRPKDHLCRECRNEYVRLWKARQRWGMDLYGYNPKRKSDQLRHKGGN